jgi:hypothetical protein
MSACKGKRKKKNLALLIWKKVEETLDVTVADKRICLEVRLVLKV